MKIIAHFYYLPIIKNHPTNNFRLKLNFLIPLYINFSIFIILNQKDSSIQKINKNIIFDINIDFHFKQHKYFYNKIFLHPDGNFWHNSSIKPVKLA